MLKYINLILFIVSVIVAEVLELLVPDSPLHKSSRYPYFALLLLGILIVYLLRVAVNRVKTGSFNLYNAPLLTGVVTFLNILNLVTAKFAFLPTLYFPTLDAVFGTLVEDRELILKCIGYSMGILSSGVGGGLILGFFTGLGAGFNKKIAYWINPVIRILGPIPATAWIPIMLIIFPTSRSASAFIIGISVWFPVTVLTSSGISNVKNSYLEVAATLGSSELEKIFKVAVPAAMPSIFIGLFNGLCASFVALMTAEMIGAKYGMGWYVNWQKEMMCYANLYAGLIVIAVLFFIVITLLFKVRDKVLLWQKGVIKW
ncbi:ABC transporter permease [Butyrivibrio sp. MC2013]|uniref:ABC transporter permease n=1 Tax=Butyrivibrio sp. MC2013 TaxID=1280686 RepID=UPI000402DB5F|nr:ABC transporter permease subunit [Butyrivibrio sp. MC2013]